MERLEQIILATLELASKKGLGNVSLQMIADKVGIRKASLFNHIVNKDDLLDKMYAFLRENAKKNVAPMEIDFNKSAYDILVSSFYNYMKICSNPNLSTFYKLIYSERAFDNKAKELVIEETNKMVFATTYLFKELVNRGKMKIDNIEVEAVGYTFALHNFIDFYIDSASLSLETPYKVEDYIKNFLRGKTGEK